jgi:hypothetical protein
MAPTESATHSITVLKTFIVVPLFGFENLQRPTPVLLMAVPQVDTIIGIIVFFCQYEYLRSFIDCKDRYSAAKSSRPARARRSIESGSQSI